MIKKDGDSRGQLLGQVLEFDKLIDYQDGAIVSKTIIGKQTGSVTLFAFDKGQGLSEHTAPFDALVYVVDGQAEVVISGEKSTVNKGQLIIMPADKPHALTASQRFKMALIMIKT